jgi:hypothetical protein
MTNSSSRSLPGSGHRSQVAQSGRAGGGTSPHQIRHAAPFCPGPGSQPRTAGLIEGARKTRSRGNATIRLHCRSRTSIIEFPFSITWVSSSLPLRACLDRGTATASARAVTPGCSLVHNLPFGLDHGGRGMNCMWGVHRLPRFPDSCSIGSFCMTAGGQLTEAHRASAEHGVCRRAVERGDIRSSLGSRVRRPADRSAGSDRRPELPNRDEPVAGKASRGSRGRTGHGQTGGIGAGREAGRVACARLERRPKRARPGTTSGLRRRALRRGGVPQARATLLS